MQSHNPPPMIRANGEARSFRVEQHRDFVSGFDHRVMLTGPSVGGYGVLKDSFGGKYLREADARKAGEIFVETGLLPAFQTDERIAACRDAAKQRIAA